MVSGVSEVQNFKANKGYFSSSTSQASSASGKRYSDNALRPWPPMYRSSSARSQMANYQALSVNSSKLNYNNNNNFNGHYANNNSIYGRTKFNFHQFNMAAAAAAANTAAATASNKKYSTSSMNLANMKNTKNYYMMPPPTTQSIYEKNQLNGINRTNNGTFYGYTGEMNANGHLEKNRFRKLRNPSTITPPTFHSSPTSSCACIRSKSMEDVRTEIVTDWTTFNKENYNEFKRNKLSNNGAFGLMRHGARRSMDNLLEVDTEFNGKQQRFQVRKLITKKKQTFDSFLPIYICVLRFIFFFVLIEHVSILLVLLKSKRYFLYYQKKLLLSIGVEKEKAKKQNKTKIKVEK